MSSLSRKMASAAFCKKSLVEGSQTTMTTLPFDIDVEESGNGEGTRTISVESSNAKLQSISEGPQEDNSTWQEPLDREQSRLSSLS
jgi:propanediol utilization protein